MRRGSNGSHYGRRKRWLTADLCSEIEADHDAAASSHEQGPGAYHYVTCVRVEAKGKHTYSPRKSNVFAKFRHDKSDGLPAYVWRRDSHNMTNATAHTGRFIKTARYAE